ncbi:MAG: hypothetical protein ACQEVA_11160 [Myxococcota bacterium]
MSNEQRIEYIAVEEFPRDEPFASAMRWLGEHPALAGTLFGVGAVLIAAANAYEGVMNAPEIALIISAVAVVAWIAFFYMARPLLLRFAVREEDFQRAIVFSDAHFQWIERHEPEIDIDEPSYTLYGAEVTAEEVNSSKRHRPVSAWLVVSGDDQRFVMRTMLTAEEANRYPTPSNDIVANVDEVLPTALVSDLLGMAGRELEDEVAVDDEELGLERAEADVD